MVTLLPVLSRLTFACGNIVASASRLRVNYAHENTHLLFFGKGAFDNKSFLREIYV